MEDTVCGGMLIHLIKQECDDELEINDAAEAALLLFKHHHNKYYEMIRNCSHGKYLISLGYEEDLKVCSLVDSINVIPILQQGKVVLLNE